MQRSSAEWIVEDPEDPTSSYPYGRFPLPSFGQVAFTNAWASIDSDDDFVGSVTGPIGDLAWQNQRLNMFSNGGTGPLDASTSELNSTGNGFTVNYR